MTLRRVIEGFGLSMVAVASVGCAEPQQPSGPPELDPMLPAPLNGGGGAPAPFVEPFPIAGTGVGTACGLVAVPAMTPGAGVPQTLLGPTVQAAQAPVPITGGTMLTTADGSTLVAADPERDQLYFLDAAGMQLLHTRALAAGDQPGRLSEDGSGRIHVVLRGGHAIATLTREAGSEITRREVCALPRGIAYDAARDLLHVACAEGKLVSLGAAPAAQPERTVDVGADVRDVLVRDGQLFVTRFRAAELLVLGADAQLMETRKPVSFAHDEQRVVQDDTDDTDDTADPQNSCGRFTAKLVHAESTPHVAWRTIDVPNVGITMLHQRARTDEVQVTQGGYGSGSCGSGIVQTSLSMGLETQAAGSTDLADLTLAVDIAADPEGQLLAIVAPGNHGGLPQLQTLPVAQLQAQMPQPSNVDPATGAAGAIAPGLPGGPACMGGSTLPDPQGQATALSFVSPYVLAVQEREPAAISFYDLRTSSLRSRVDLAQPSRSDTGHALFHLRAGAGVACASCHPEAGDDGHVWTFAKIGPRRTQTLRGGLLGTEPLHWNGDMRDFGMLMKEVFVGRMSGFDTSPDQTDALAHWLDQQPALHADGADALAVARGKALFESAAVGCADCHSGPHLTNNETEDVGTGAPLQVPSLKGLKFRTPLMHDGCAPSVAERFSDERCGGGDDHGHVSQLSASELSDLIAYLETL